MKLISKSFIVNHKLLRLASQTKVRYEFKMNVRCEGWKSGLVERQQTQPKIYVEHLAAQKIQTQNAVNGGR